MHTEAALKAHYSDVRSRIWSAKPKLRPKNDNVRSVISFIPQKPLWKRAEINFDAHVLAHKVHIARAGSPKRNYIISRCKELGFSYTEVIGPHRQYDIVRVRQLIMWEVKQLWPETSFPEMGRMFGGRDHTTVLSALRKIDGILSDVPNVDSLSMTEKSELIMAYSPSTITPEHVQDKVMELYRCKVNKYSISKTLGISSQAVGRIIKTRSRHDRRKTRDE